MSVEGKTAGNNFSLRTGVAALALFVFIPFTFYQFQRNLNIEAPGYNMRLAENTPSTKNIQYLGENITKNNDPGDRQQGNLVNFSNDNVDSNETESSNANPIITETTIADKKPSNSNVVSNSDHNATVSEVETDHIIVNESIKRSQEGVTFLESLLIEQVDYNTLVLAYHKKIKAFKGINNLSLYTNGGVYGSYLNTLDVQVEFYEGFDLQDGFGNLDYGINVGLSADYKLSSTANVFLGIQNQTGLAHVFQGTKHIPADFFNNFTNSAGIQLGILKKL